MCTYTNGLKAPSPEHELNQNSNRHVKEAQGKTMKLPPYTNNYRQLKNSEKGRKSSSGKLIPNNVKQAEKAILIYLGTCVCVCVYIHIHIHIFMDIARNNEN